MLKRATVFILLFLFSGSVARAGFGVSPPCVSSDQVRPGTRFEQTVVLLRTEAKNDLPLTIAVEAPEIGQWISFSQPDSFVMPAGQLRLPLTVFIDFPADADIGTYQGKINIMAGQKTGQAGMIGISTGAEIGVDMELTDKIRRSFVINDFKIPDRDLNEGFLSRWAVFRRLKAEFRLENQGNAAVAPDKVTIDVADMAANEFVASAEDTGFKPVAAWQSAWIEAGFPLDLPAGQYWGRVKVYSQENVVYSASIAFSVIAGDSMAWQYWGGGLMLLVILMVLGAVFIWRRRKKASYY